MHKTAIARFSGTLSSLVTSGVPILESLDIVSETAGNVTVGIASFRRRSKGSAKGVRWRTS